MTADQWLVLGACSAQLGLAFVALVRTRGGGLGAPLILLSLDIFTWNIAKLAFTITGTPAWQSVEAAALPLMTPLGVHFILAFIGQSRALRPWLVLCYGVFVALALSAATPLVFPMVGAGVGNSATLVLLCSIPPLTFTLVRLVNYLRRVSEPAEQTRGWMLLAALVISMALLFTELGALMGYPVPRLGSVAALVGTLAMTLVLLRFPLLERQIPTFVALIALGVAALATWACMFALRLGHGALSAVLCAIFAVSAFLALRSAIVVYGRRRKKQGRLAHQGRFSVQMAHDLRNPLAALKGAAEYLREEVRAGRPSASQLEYFDLMITQIERLSRIVDEHQRMGRLMLHREPQQLNALVSRALALRPLGATSPIALSLDLCPDLPPCAIDGDLLSRAVENLCQNAVEAMPEGGRLTVKTAVEESGEVLLSISDTGQGMDARTRARATDAFFTTKQQGSGLGLSFARDVVEGHGGQLLLSSTVGRGTTVSVRLPVG
jgi:signal transduction histidine kinase